MEGDVKNLKELKNKWLLKFEEYLLMEKGRSMGTIRIYIQKLNNFFRWLEVNNLNFNEEALYFYRKFLFKQGLSLKTISYYLIAIRGFLKFLIKRNIKIISPDNIELPKIPERDIDILDLKDLKKLLNLQFNKNKLTDLRDRAILETLFSTGMRVSELCSLNRNIDLESGEIKIRGKGNKVRIVFLSETAKEALKEYLSARNDNNEALFVNLSRFRGYSRLTPRGVEIILKKLATRANLNQKLTPHTLRHQFATDLLRSGADLRAVQILLGHKNIQTTQIYTHLTDKYLKEIHKNFHAKFRKKDK